MRKSIALLIFCALLLPGCSGTRVGNPTPVVPTATVSLQTTVTFPAGLTQFAMGTQTLTLYPSDSAQSTVSVPLTAGVVSLNNGVTRIQSAQIPIRSYARAELSLAPADSLGNNSLQVMNTSGTYQVDEELVLAFDGPFDVSASSSALQLAMDSFANPFGSVTSDSQLRSTAEATTGTVGATAVPGLAAWWPFEGTFLDSSGSGFTTQVWGSPSLITGKIGQAAALSGISNFLQINDFAAPNATGMSVVFWVYYSSLPGVWATVVGKGTGGGDGGYQFVIGDGGVGGTISLSTSDPGGHSNNLCSIPLAGKTGIWIHYAFVWSVAGSSCQAYENGVLAASQSTTIRMSTSGNPPLMIGGSVYGAPYPAFDGRLDDIRFYNRALSASEVQAIEALGQ